MLYAGVVAPFAEFVDELIAEGRFGWQEWTFPFDYRRLLQSLEALGGVDVVARSYDGLDGRSLFEDFFAILGLTPGDVGLGADHRAFPRPPLADLVRAFRRNRKAAPLDAIEEDLVTALWGDVPGTALDMSRRSRRRLAAAFEEANRWLYERWAIAPFPGMTALREPPDDGDGVLSLETVFSPASDDRLARLAAAIRADRAALGSEVERLERACARTAAERDAVRRELDLLRSSRSWRITAPLRSLRALLA